jgi:hypothetical protein
LLGTGARVYALNLDSGDEVLARFLRRARARSLRFVARRPSRWQLFPRDMFLLAERAGVLLVHADLFRLTRSTARGYAVVHSRWAEGGRVLLSGDRLIVGRYPGSRTSRSGALAQLARRGMRIASIPLPIIAHLERGTGRTRVLRYDTHVDRSASLVRDRDGGCHLFLGPGYRTGLLDAPSQAAASADAVRRACEKIDVSVHQLADVAGPYGVATVQLGSGHVLVSAAEQELRAELATLVGAHKVLPVRPSLEAYPVFGAAGLHCLVTDVPTPLVGPVT